MPILKTRGQSVYDSFSGDCCLDDCYNIMCTIFCLFNCMCTWNVFYLLTLKYVMLGTTIKTCSLISEHQCFFSFLDGECREKVLWLKNCKQTMCLNVICKPNISVAVDLLSQTFIELVMTFSTGFLTIHMERTFS